MPDPKPEKPDIEDYLRSDDIVDFNDPSIEEATEHLTSGLRDNFAKSQAIYEFVRDQIFSSFEIDATSVTVCASEVLEKGHGLCYGQSHLVAALMRSAGIPAGFCYQVIYDQEDERHYVHALNAVYLEELDRWVRFDTSIKPDDSSIRPDFYEDPPVRAIDSNLGESEDMTVYINPNKRIVKLLHKHDNLDDLCEHLPEKL